MASSANAPSEKKEERLMTGGIELLQDDDRISKLPDELIHLILGLLDGTKLAVRTCVLSTRWKNLWTTLPHIYLKTYPRSSLSNLRFFESFFSNRNNQNSVVSTIKTVGDIEDGRLLRKIIDYAGPHNIQKLEIAQLFSNYHLGENVDYLKISSWNLPNLTTLSLRNVPLHLSFYIRWGNNEFNKIMVNRVSTTLVNLRNLSLVVNGRAKYIVDMSSTELENLTIFIEGQLSQHVISAPKLKSLHYQQSTSPLEITGQLNCFDKVKKTKLGWLSGCSANN